MLPISKVRELPMLRENCMKYDFFGVRIDLSRGYCTAPTVSEQKDNDDRPKKNELELFEGQL